MLSRLTKKMRLRAAVIIAVLYALCGLTPAFAIALTDNPAGAAHCLTDHRGDAKSLGLHDHGGGAVHSHAGDAGAAADVDDDGSPSGNCCGLFCTSALPAAAHLKLGEPAHGSITRPALHEQLTGLAPDRINRPPILSLSL